MKIKRRNVISGGVRRIRITDEAYIRCIENNGFTSYLMDFHTNDKNYVKAIAPMDLKKLVDELQEVLAQNPWGNG